MVRGRAENRAMHVQSYLTQVIHGHSRPNLDQRIDRLLTRGGPHVHVTLLSLFRSGSLRAIMPFVWQQAHQQFGMYRTLFDCRIYEDLAQRKNPIKNHCSLKYAPQRYKSLQKM